MAQESTYEDQLAAVIYSVTPTEPALEAAAWERLDSLTKPPRSLGRLESIGGPTRAYPGHRAADGRLQSAFF